MTILRTLPDDRRCPADQGQPATYRNTETHWWDGSQLYGSDLGRQHAVRTDPASGQLRADGKIHLDAQGHLPVDQSSEVANLELSGVNGNWWVGLSVLHTLFAREHNAIVDRLRVDYPTADGEWLFQKARLVNAALIAKIHTVEWTPALTSRMILVWERRVLAAVVVQRGASVSARLVAARLVVLGPLRRWVRRGAVALSAALVLFGPALLALALLLKVF